MSRLIGVARCSNCASFLIQRYPMFAAMKTATKAVHQDCVLKPNTNVASNHAIPMKAMYSWRLVMWL